MFERQRCRPVMRSHSGKGIAIKLDYSGIYLFLATLYIYTLFVLSFPHTSPTSRELLWDDNATSEGGEYPRPPDNLSCCHPPTSAGLWKKGGKSWMRTDSWENDVSPRGTCPPRVHVPS